MRPFSVKTYRFANYDDLTGTVNALRVAAERFEEHATECDAIVGMMPVAKQFRYQAEQARRIADQIDEMAY